MVAHEVVKVLYPMFFISLSFLWSRSVVAVISDEVGDRELSV